MAPEAISKTDYEAAAVRVEQRVALCGHLTWFFWLNLLFLAVNALLTPEAWWSPVIAGAWAIALFMHAVGVLFVGDLQGPVRKRWMLRELDKLEPRDESQAS